MILDDMVATRNEKNLLCGWNNVHHLLFEEEGIVFEGNDQFAR